MLLWLMLFGDIEWEKREWGGRKTEEKKGSKFNIREWARFNMVKGYVYTVKKKPRHWWKLTALGCRLYIKMILK